MEKRGQRGRPPRRRPAAVERPSTLSIGNCRVELPNSLLVSVDAGGLSVNVPEVGNIKIAVASETPVLPAEFSITLLNPKSLDVSEKVLLQEVLKLYTEELPAMKYAANTGKESKFLESCVFDGKYCTIVLRDQKAELVGAITYQILPSEAQAEIPLAAIARSYHRKGFGAGLYKELQKRLLDVGIISIFCWGDGESLAFWAKQGFVVVAEVDARGKPWKLPIKADIRRAMSIPGSATLLISYLSSPCTTVANLNIQSSKIVDKNSPETSSSPASISSVSPKDQMQGVRGQKKSPHMTVTTPPAAVECKPHQDTSTTPAVLDSTRMGKLPFTSVTPLNMERMLSDVASESPSVAAKRKCLSQSHSLLIKPNEGPASVTILEDITNTAGSVPAGLVRPFKKRRIIGSLQASTEGFNGETEADCQKSPNSDVVTGVAPMPFDGNGNTASPAIALSGQIKNGRARLRSGQRLQPPEVARDVAGGSERVQEKSKTPAISTQVNSVSRLKAGIRGRGKRLRESRVPSKACSRRSVPEESASAEVSAEPRATASSLGYQQGIENSPERGCKAPEDGPQSLENLQPSNEEKGADQRRMEAASRLSAEHDSGDLESRMMSGMNVASNPATTSHPLVEQEVLEMNSAVSKKQTVESVPVENGDHSNIEAHVADGATPAVKSLPKTKPVIMFMNMADENQKKQLAKHVEKLEGKVTSDGHQCTHMVTREVRRTLNFCVAISSGAWILSPDWLKTSVKQKRFAEESRFVLRDKQFELKYKFSLQEVIFRARQRPNALFDGMSIYATPHVHPPVETTFAIVKAAGGQILQSLDQATTSEEKWKVAVVACEEDVSEAIAAAKAGVRTFTSDWLLTCVAKQELDLAATQFSESL